MHSVHQIGNPDLLINTAASLEDQLYSLAKARGTVCHELGPQASLFAPETVEHMVTVSNGKESLTVRADLAARFGLFPTV